VARFVDCYADFVRHKDEYVYVRTDHHWTADGAYLAYRAFGKAEGFAPVALGSLASGELPGFMGSLYSDTYLNPASKALEKAPDTVRYYYPAYAVTAYNYQDYTLSSDTEVPVLLPDTSKIASNYNVFFGGDTRLLHMKSAVANGKSVLVVRDSYGHAFLPFLANSYEDVYAVEPRYFESFPLAYFIADHGIDELLFLNHPLTATAKYWFDWTGELQKLFKAAFDGGQG
jgi:hypothetical protein